jgi:hypothetical protein
MSFHQVFVPYDLLPSLLPFFKGITPFPPNRPEDFAKFNLDEAFELACSIAEVISD